MRIERLAETNTNRINSTAKVLNSIGITALVVMMVLTAADVILRYIFSKPITGAYEINEFMMAVLVSFSLAYAAVHKAHINVDILTTKLKPAAQSLVNCITTLLSMELFILICWQSVLYAGKLRVGGNVSTNLFIPVYPFVYMMAVGSLLISLVLLNDLMGHFKDLFKKQSSGYVIKTLLLIVVAFLLFSTLLLGKQFPFRTDTLTAGAIGIVLLLLLLFSGMSIGMVMGLIGFLGMTYISGLKPGLNILGTTPYLTASSYSLSVVPLFVLMGSFCLHAGLSRDLYYAVNKWMGHLPGGLAIATVGACAGFAAVSGSSVATTATMGMVALPEMKKYKYDLSLASGCIAAGGSIGVLIPPSVILVIYAILTEQSIGQLFLAGFIPGITEALFYMVTIYIICKRYPLRGPKAERVPYKERIVALKGVWGVVVLFVVVIGGIYLGIFTPTEAAGIGAFGAMLFALGRRQLTWKRFVSSLDETGKTTAMVFVILIGAGILGYFLAVTRLPFMLVTVIGELEVNRYIILAAVVMIYLLLGAIMSSMAMVVLTVPIIFPVITALGFNPVWFGIIIVRVVEMGQITPPVGINVYVMKGTSKDVSMQTIFRGVVPFIIADILHICMLIIFPQIATFLPNMMN